MKINIEVDREKALKLAQEIEKMQGVKNLSMRYKTKGILEKNE